MTSGSVLFHEDQRLRQWWVVLAVAVVCAAAVMAAGAVAWQYAEGARAWPPQGGEWGDVVGAAVGLVIAAGVAWLVLTARLTTEVRDEGLFVRYYPLHLREHRIALENVTRVAAVTYRPVLQYGGWGIRYTWRGKAYNVSGNRGVRLDFANGRHLLIGSERAEELERAISAAGQS